MIGGECSEQCHNRKNPCPEGYICNKVDGSKFRQVETRQKDLVIFVILVLSRTYKKNHDNNNDEIDYQKGTDNRINDCHNPNHDDCHRNNPRPAKSDFLRCHHWS